nr:T9SS type B sorting domain-containing protein [uncultured Flavobacterium sp.]
MITVVGHDGTVTGTGTGYYYSFDNGSTYDVSNTFTVNDNGSIQTIMYAVKDANGCTTAPQPIVVNPLNKPTDLIFALTTAPTCTVTTSTVTLTATNGVGTLQYETIAPSAAVIAKQTSNVFAGLIPGDYTFQVTDANGCTYQELYTVKAVTPIAISGSAAANISCNALNGTSSNGSAAFTVTGFSSTGNYTIVTSPVLTAAQISTAGDVITLTGLTAGTYTVTVTDKTTLCSQSDSVTLTAPAAIAFTAIASKVYCSQDVSQITVSAVTGGTGVYTYAAVKAGASAPIASAYDSNPVISADTNLTDLSWDVYVKDASGCISAKVTVPVTFNAAPTITAPAVQCFEGTPFTVDLSPTAVTTSYNGVKTYTVNGFAIASSIATFNGPGTYTLGVKDDNGCEAFVTYTIKNQLLAAASLTKDLYCAAPVNATIAVAITDGTAPYSYQMYSGATAVGSLVTGVAGTSFTVSVAAAGTYHFVITDSSGTVCSVTTNTVEVKDPSLSRPVLTASQINVSCTGGNNGSITVTAASGTAPYAFALAGPAVNHTGDATGIYTGLTAGSYTVTVTDDKGCTAAVPAIVVIIEPVVLTATAVVTPFGCSITNAPQDAIVTITAIDGTAPYSYSFDGGVTFQTASSFTVNVAGTINYVVLDANGCKATGSENVVPYTPPTDMNISASPVYCNAPLATVTINSVTGGVASYTYNIDGGTYQASNIFNNLLPKIYVFGVKDANGCVVTKPFEVKETSKITASGQLLGDVLCNGGATGSAEFTVENYATAYTATLTTGTGVLVQAGNKVTITGLAGGNYTVTVLDNTTGCTNTASVVVAEPLLALSSTSFATNINCKNDNATISVTATGGTAPYKYAVARATDPVPALASFIAANQLVVDTNNGSDMNWVVYVTDANGCSINKPQLIILNASPIISSAIATKCPSATGTYDITVTATGFSTALEYSLDGVSFQSSNIITVNAAGNYNVTVKDANGCLSAATPVTVLQPLSLSVVVATAPSCADNDGVVNVSATGGSANYLYNIDGGVFVAGNSFTGVTFGLHRMGVYDTTTKCEFYVPIDLSRATRVTGFDLSMTPVTCKGGNDGTITATMDTPATGINDNPVYMYSLNGGTPQTSNIFTGLTAGNGYTVTVTSGRGCNATDSIDVIEPGIITVPAPIVAQFGCTANTNSSNFATITVAGVTGGSNVYNNYEFIKVGTPNTQVQFGTSNVYTEANLKGGSYIVNVYDSKGCVGNPLAPIVINPFISLDKINVTVPTAITCTGNEEISVTVKTTGGTPATGKLVYTVTGISGTVYNGSNTTGTFVNLGVGNYLIAVTNTDTGCKIETIHYVNEPNTFALKAVKTKDVVCYGSNEGTVELTIIDNQLIPTNDAGVFDYVITSSALALPINGTSTSAGPWSITGLKAGLYNVTATLKNSPKCSVTTSFTINQPAVALAIIETHTAITCVSGNNDGTISVSASGGWAGDYQFEVLKNGSVFSAYSAQTDYANLSAGNYIINVKDVNGCVAFVPVVLSNPKPIVITAVANVAKVSCFGDKSATITASVLPGGGQGSNYLYTLNYESMSPVISSGPQSSPVFTDLGAGKYSVTVTDGWGCSATSLPVTIDEPTRVEAGLVMTTQQTCKIQATVTLTATGGTAPYSYSDTPNFVISTPMASNSVVISVGNGIFRYYVRDVNGCISVVSNDIQNDPLEPLAIDLDVRNAVINCQGDMTGFVVAVAKGGLGNYVYSLLDASGNAIASAVQATSGTFTQLAAGTYFVKVSSGDCEFTSAPINIIEPKKAIGATFTAIDVTCNGNGDGKIIINASGGTGIIKYAVSPNMNQYFETNTFENLKPGLYDVIVQDQNGCFILFKDIEIKEPTAIVTSVVPGSVVQEYCSGDKTGAFNITIAGGVGPYSTSIDNPKGTYILGQVAFTGLSGGSHTVYIKDQNTCIYELIVQLDAAVTLNPVAVLSYDCVNDLPANKVTVTIDSSNNPADVVYSLDSSSVTQTSNVFTNLVPGDHFIMVHHKNGCVDATAVFHIDQVDPLAMTLNLGKLNEIVATTTGGSGVYHYSVNGEDIGSSNKYIYYHSGDYTFTVTDSNGCSLSVPKYFEFVDIEIPNVFTPNGNGPNPTWKPLKTENYPNLKFVVYDRYGREVGHFGSGESWDGKYKGAELPMGDYWYVLKLRNSKDDREFIGHFTLYR